MLKSFWQFVLLISVLVVAGHAIAQNVTVPTQQPIWSIDMKGGIPFLMAAETQLLVAETGTAGEPSTLSALDPATGNRLWKSDRQVGGLIAVENQTIYADDFGRSGWRTGNLLTLDAKTGKTQTVVPLIARKPDPAANNSEGSFVNFDEVIGIDRGAFICQSSITRNFEPLQNRVMAQTPTQVRWTFDTSPNSHLFERYGTVQDGVVILPILLNPKTGQRSTQVKALDAATGKLLWELNTEENSARTLGDAVYLLGSTRKGSSNVGWLKALDLKTGKERWTRSGLNGKPTLANDREVFVLEPSEQSDTHYTVLDRQTGAVLRQITLVPSSRYGGKPQLAGNTIYQDVVQSTGSWTTVKNYSRIEAFDATNGKLLWQTPLRRGGISEAIIMGDRLVISSTGFGEEKNVVQGFKIP